MSSLIIDTREDSVTQPTSNNTMNDSVLHFQSDALLDNPIWNSLATRHAHLALGERIGHGLACRYPSDIGPLSAFQEPTPRHIRTSPLSCRREMLRFSFLKINPRFLRAGSFSAAQHSFRWSAPRFRINLLSTTQLSRWRPADIPEMVARADLTEPGPFRYGTAKLGGFLGIRVDGRLAAMSGQRLSPTGFAEVSAVCTHPDFRGRGYAQALVAAVTRNIRDEGRTPFLTSLEANTGAVRIYQRVGFVVRRTFQLAVLKPPSLAHQ